MSRLTRVSAGLKFTSDILSKQPQYCSDIWKIFRTFFRHLFLPSLTKLLSALHIMKQGVVLLPFRTVSADWLAQGSHEHWKTWKTWKITKKSSMHGKIMEFEKNWKIMEFCEIICVFDCLFSGYWWFKFLFLFQNACLVHNRAYTCCAWYFIVRYM